MKILIGDSMFKKNDKQCMMSRVFTGQITNLLTGAGLGGLGGGGSVGNNIQYGFESTCPDGVNQNTALLATAAAIGT